MDFTAENVCGFLIRSKLMTPEEMKNMYQRWQAEVKDPAPSIQTFLKWLVAKDYVTEYQAGLLLKGHSEPHDYFLNQYRILDRLGRGRMAGVYKAQHTLGQIVAIKVLPPSKSKNPQYLARFHREAELALQLKHPNVVRTFQVGESRGLNYLVMEYLEGETLDEVLSRRKRLPHGEAVRLIHQALTGLQHINDRGMVHRDLKPANLMLVPAHARGEPDTTLQATVKILDIGLGRMAFEDSETGNEGPELTSEGMLLGTPDYLAPEQARDARTIDIRADIYSLGCVLYHCLTAQPPFPDKNLLNQLVRHATETAKPIKEASPQTPDGLQQVLNYMMAKQPEQRYPTPERAAQALQVFLMADAAAPRPIEESQEMKRFLNALKSGGAEGKAAPPAAAAAQPRPSPAPVATPVASRAAPAAAPAAALRSAPAAVAPPPPPSAPPRPAPAPPPKAAAPPPPAPVDARQSGARKKPDKTPIAQGVGPPPGMQEVNVELVSGPPASAAPFGWVPNRLRDFLFIGYGVAFASLVWLVIWLLSGSGDGGTGGE